MKFSDLVFECVESRPDGDVLQAVIRFDNGLGLSVICGPGTLSSPDNPYEAAVLNFVDDKTFKIIYPDFTQNDVLSFLTEEQVMEYIQKVSSVTDCSMETDNYHYSSVASDSILYASL